MPTIFAALSTWLHTLATIVLIGHYLLLVMIYLPVLMKNSPDLQNGVILSDISSRSRVWMYAALLVFFITGVFLTLVDPNYTGLGNFGTPWAVLMLIKHLLVVGMLGLGFWFNAIFRVGPLMSSNSGAALAYKRFRTYAWLMSITGILILLLTALAQVY